jgi:hypothetical protein
MKDKALRPLVAANCLSIYQNNSLNCRRSGMAFLLRNLSNQQEFAHLSTGLADQLPLVSRGQFLDRRLHPASFRLVHAGKLDEQPARWIRTGVARPRAGNVLCVAHVHISGNAGVDRSATTEDEIDVPALRRSCLRRSHAGR